VSFGKGKEMRRMYLAILTLAIAIGLLLAGAAPCPAAEDEGKVVVGPAEKEGKIVRWDEDRPRVTRARPPAMDEGERTERLMERLRNADPELADALRRMQEENPEAFSKLVKLIAGPRRPTLGRPHVELTEERIEHIMQRLREDKPEKAKELEKLRQEDPEAFRAELRSMIPRPAAVARTRPPRPTPGRPTRPGRSRRPRPPDVYTNWLQVNYPDLAKELEELKQDNEELYGVRLAQNWRKHGRIYAASKRNPELAEVLKEDLELKERRDMLLGRIRGEDNEDEKKQLTEELQEVVGARFDILVRKKQIEYEELVERLEDLKREVEESADEVEQWKEAEFKRGQVEARVEELLGRTEKFTWD